MQLLDIFPGKMGALERSSEHSKIYPTYCTLIAVRASSCYKPMILLKWDKESINHRSNAKTYTKYAMYTEANLQPMNRILPWKAYKNYKKQTCKQNAMANFAIIFQPN